MRYLDDVLEHDVDTLILGCTHYPLLRSAIKKLLGEQVTLINPAYETAKELEKMLAASGLANSRPVDKNEPYPYKFFVSDDPSSRNSYLAKVIHHPDCNCSIIDINDLASEERREDLFRRIHFIAGVIIWVTYYLNVAEIEFQLMARLKYGVLADNTARDLDDAKSSMKIYFDHFAIVIHFFDEATHFHRVIR
jgi:hypothetical protein